MGKGKSIYFSKKELENLMEFYNHWDDKLTSNDENFYSYYIGKVGSAFGKIANALQDERNLTEEI